MRIETEAKIQLNKSECVLCNIIAYLVIFIAFANLCLVFEGGKRIIHKIKADAKKRDECKECEERHKVIPITRNDTDKDADHDYQDEQG